MDDTFRSFQDLLYPLGFLSSIAFTARFVLQWLSSEKAGKSVVTKSFWQISLAGNLALLIHSMIQMQLHVSLIQTANAIISKRNIELMGPSEKRSTLLSVVISLAAALMAVLLFFIWIGGEWFRTPLSDQELSWPWHFAGTTGLLLFNCRFWIQWWQSEKSMKSELNASFWWMSLVGASLMIVYFGALKDTVNLIGPVFGLIPYARNLMLLKKQGDVKVER